MLLWNSLSLWLGQKRNIFEQYAELLADPFFPHDWEEARLLEEEWQQASTEQRRQEIVDECSMLLQMNCTY